MTEPLFELLQKAAQSTVKKILIADPGRPPFWALVDRCADTFNSEVITRRLHSPWKSEKYILIVDHQ